MKVKFFQFFNIPICGKMIGGIVLISLVSFPVTNFVRDFGNLSALRAQAASR